MGPHPAVAAIRLAVRRTLADLAAEAGSTFTAPAREPRERVPGVPVAAAALPAAVGTTLIGNAHRHPSGLPRTLADLAAEAGSTFTAPAREPRERVPGVPVAA
ncbi:tRNA lysidine(34) synthetase TilS, partial [Kitasatospora sp. NPDC089913]